MKPSVIRGVLFFVGLTAAGAGPEAAVQDPVYRNAIGMEFVLINPGTFVVGKFDPPYARPDAEADPAAGGRGRGGGRGGVPPTAEEYRLIREAVERDRSAGFAVTIARAFYLGKFEVTQAQYQQVMGANPSVFQGAQVQGSSENNPVDSVTWDQAQAFVRRLNTLEKTTAYRLPTEFEWEYAARAGADDDIPWAEIRQQGYNSGQTTQAVGKMQPNRWGLYDMLGNVWEWVQDYYNEKIFADPTPPRSGRQHVLKGGGITSDVKNMTYMWHGAGPGNGFDVGFRIVRDVR